MSSTTRATLVAHPRDEAAAGLEIKAPPHMLRHACGYALANKGHDTRAIQGWLGHRSTSTAERNLTSFRVDLAIVAEIAHAHIFKPHPCD
jgi:site-specific recombinase XerD